METPDDPSRVAGFDELYSDLWDIEDEIDEAADEADAQNDAAWLEERGL